MRTQRDTREGLIAELENTASGCMAGERLRLEAEQGTEALRRGAESVQVGHTTYVVTEDPPRSLKRVT